MKISEFATDVQAEVEGVWIDVGDGLKLRVARFGNKRFQRYLASMAKPFSRTSPTNEIAEGILRKAIARHVLMDWENLTEEDGTDIGYSEEKAVELFESHNDFYMLVQDLSKEVDNFKRTTDEEAEGNS